MSTSPNRTVLIVEDDPMVRRLLMRHFQKTSAQVTEAADAAEGLAAFTAAGAGFDVVVTDVHLPGKTGLDLATELRMHRPSQPIVFITGDIDENLARRALESGKAGYLLKPFEFFELDAAVAQAVQSASVTTAPPLRSSAPAIEKTDWYAEQRRQLEAAAQRPLDLRLLVHGQRADRSRPFIKIGLTVLVLLGLAWIIGYALFPDDGRDKRAAPSVAEPATQEKTIYVPDEPPKPPAPGRDRQR